jgi:hypothetical protein
MKGRDALVYSTDMIILSMFLYFYSKGEINIIALRILNTESLHK